MIEELYEQYGQFLVIGLILLVAFGVYYAHKYYYNKENVEEYLHAFLSSDTVQKIIFWSQEGTEHPRFPYFVLENLNVPIFKELEKEIIKKYAEYTNISEKISAW